MLLKKKMLDETKRQRFFEEQRHLEQLLHQRQIEQQRHEEKERRQRELMEQNFREEQLREERKRQELLLKQLRRQQEIRDEKHRRELLRQRLEREKESLEGRQRQEKLLEELSKNEEFLKPIQALRQGGALHNDRDRLVEEWQKKFHRCHEEKQDYDSSGKQYLLKEIHSKGAMPSNKKEFIHDLIDATHCNDSSVKTNPVIIQDENGHRYKLTLEALDDEYNENIASPKSGSQFSKPLFNNTNDFQQKSFLNRNSGLKGIRKILRRVPTGSVEEASEDELEEEKAQYDWTHIHPHDGEWIEPVEGTDCIIIKNPNY
jgi:hypothetical protein